MFNAIKAKLVLNAIKDFKMKSVVGGEGNFVVKGLTMDVKGFHFTLGEVVLKYSFPMGTTSVVEGKVQFDRELDAVVSLMVKGVSIKENGCVFELEEVELNSTSSIKEFMLDLPLKEMVEAIAIS